MNEKLPREAHNDAAVAPWWTLLVAGVWPAVVLVVYVRSVLVRLVLDLLR